MTNIVRPFNNFLLNSKNQNSPSNFHVVKDTISWPANDNHFFIYKKPPTHNKNKREPTPDEYENECFLNLKSQLEYYYDLVCYTETLENIDNYEDFINLYCPPKNDWSGSNYFFFPVEGRRLLDLLKLQQNIIFSIKTELISNLENKSDSGSDFE